MKSLKIFLFILLAFFITDVSFVKAEDVTGSVTVTVTKANQAPLVFNGQTVVYRNNFVPLSTTGGSGAGTVSYAVTVHGAGCSISGTTLSYSSAGECGVTATKLGGTDYNDISSTATFRITAKPITVTVTAGQTKVYGSSNPIYAYTASPALITGDSFSGALSRTAGENIGSYPINIGTLSAGGNYAITLVSNNFTITKKPITVTATASQTKIYGNSNPIYAYTSSPALITGDSFTGALSRTVGESVGTYPINIGTLSAGGNYAITLVSNNFTITKKPITITATAGQTKVFGASDPTFTYTSSPALITGDSFTGALSRTAGEAVGTYPINIGTLSAGNNYTVTFVANNFTITLTNYTLTILASGGTGGGTYGGTPAGTIASGTNVSITATPNATSNFTRWVATGAATTNCNNATTLSCTFVMTANASVQAIYNLKGAPMSGTLTPATSSCTISRGSTYCNVNLNWSITNPVGTPTAITASGMTNINVKNNLIAPFSGTQSVIVPYSSRLFHLYNNSIDLATATVTSSCNTAAGDNWNGTACALGLFVPTIQAIPTDSSGITKTTIATGGDIISDGGRPITEKGIVWGTSVNPTTSSYVGKITSGSGSNDFITNITGLTANTNYYIRAYAINSQGVGYGSIPITTAQTGFITACESNSSLKVSWNPAPGAMNYVVTRAGYPGNRYTGTGLSFSDTGLTLGSTYTYTLNTGGSGGIYGTSTVSGTVTNCSGMSGSLTPATSTCTIALNGTGCNLNLNWSITNPVATPTSITASGMTDINVKNNLIAPFSGTQSVTVPYTSSPRTFYLYNNSVQLATATATAIIDPGICTWNGSSCVTPSVMSGTLTPATSTCTIATTGNSCNASLNWSITNPVATPTAITASGMTNINVKNNLVAPFSGTQSVPVSYPSRLFHLYNNSVDLATATVTVSCDSANGYSWDAGTSKCKLSSVPSGSLTANPTSCTINAGANYCNTTLTWNVVNPIASALTAVVNNYDSTSLVGSPKTAIVHYLDGTGTPGGNSFYLYHNGILLQSIFVPASCATNTVWDGAVCKSTSAVNLDPGVVTITGPTSFPKGSIQTFGFTATDPNGDNVRYGVDWSGFSSVSQWTPYIGSGQTDFLSNNPNIYWPNTGTYTFRAIASDSKGAWSPAWSLPFTVTVTEPVTSGSITSFTSDAPNDKINFGEDVRLTWTSTGTKANQCSISSPSDNLLVNGLATNPTSSPEQRPRFVPLKSIRYYLKCIGNDNAPVYYNNNEPVEIRVGDIEPDYSEN